MMSNIFKMGRIAPIVGTAAIVLIISSCSGSGGQTDEEQIWEVRVAASEALYEYNLDRSVPANKNEDLKKLHCKSSETRSNSLYEEQTSYVIDMDDVDIKGDAATATTRKIRVRESSTPGEAVVGVENYITVEDNTFAKEDGVWKFCGLNEHTNDIKGFEWIATDPEIREGVIFK